MPKIANVQVKTKNAALFAHGKLLSTFSGSYRISAMSHVESFDSDTSSDDFSIESSTVDKSVIEWEIPQFLSCPDEVLSEVKKTENFDFQMRMRFDLRQAYCAALFYNVSDKIADGTRISFELSILPTSDKYAAITGHGEFYSTEALMDTRAGTPYVQELAAGYSKASLARKEYGYVNAEGTLRLRIRVGTIGVWDSRKETGFVGLKNQGATCYMNSVLQSLYHIPAFRRIVYNMPTTGSEDPEKCIPLNLQRLFCQMQFAEQPVSTKALTKSFGWGDYETIMQHDVQEFCRVLVDNLEMKMKGTDMADDIAKLFRGRTRSYIRCVNVKYESSREETFYDLSMVVKGCKSLTESFEKYVEKDIMDGDNQYQTDDFGKQDAEMGVEFLEFPVVLQLHLSRFQYDFARDMMVKINDRFEFPQVIDLSPYVAEDGEKQDLIYELFGVLVHWGGVGAGHYYSFLRPTQDRQWFKFDDDMVTCEKTRTAVNDNFGGRTEKGSIKRYSGYMLVYVRQSEIGRVFQPLTEDDVPDHLKEYAKQEAERREAKRTQKLEALLTANVFVRDSSTLTKLTLKGVHKFKTDDVICDFRVDRTTGIEELYDQVAEHLKLPVDTIRLWKTNSSRHPTHIVDPKVMKGIKQIAERYPPNDIHLFLERKGADEPLQLPRGMCMIFAKFYFPEAEAKIQFIDALHIQEKDTLEPAIEELNNRLGFPKGTEMLAYLETVSSRPHLLSTNIKLVDMNVGTGSVIIFQLPAGSELKTTFAIQPPIPKTPADHEDEDDDQKDKLDVDLPLIDANDIFPVDIGTVDVYLDTVDRQAEILIYDYDDFMSPKFKLKFTTTLSVDKVKQVLARGMKLDYDPETSAMRLYQKGTGEGPAKDPIATYKNLSYLFGTSTKYSYKNSWRLYVQFIKGISETEMESLAQYTVHLATDGYCVDHRLKVLAQKRATSQEITEKVKEKLGLEKLDGPFRWYFVYNGKPYCYKGPMTADSIIDYTYYTLRIDAIPAEQQNLESDEYLMEVVFMVVRSGYNYQTEYRAPFYLKVRPDETIGQVKAEIAQHLTERQQNDLKEASLEVEPSTSWSAAAKDKVKVKDEDVLSTVAGKNRLTISIKGKAVDSHYNQAVKIFN